MAAKKVVAKKTAPAVAVAVAQVGEVTLESIVAATQAGSFVYTAAAVHGPLIEAGFVEINPAMADENGAIATRSTEKGNSQVMTATNQTQAAAPAVKAGFVIETGVTMPAISGRGRSGCSYPFDQMEVNQSFFVAASESKPNPAKSLASTISSANARYAVPVTDGSTRTTKKGAVVPATVETRKFVVRSVTENGVAGARVWRTL